MYYFMASNRRLCALVVLLIGAARNANGADNITFHDDRNTTFRRDRSSKAQHAEAFRAGRQRILQCFRGTLEQCRRTGLFDGHFDAAELGIIHLFKLRLNIHHASFGHAESKARRNRMSRMSWLESAAIPVARPTRTPTVRSGSRHRTGP